MDRIGRNFFLNVETHFENYKMKSHQSGDKLVHFKRHFRLEFIFPF